MIAEKSTDATPQLVIESLRLLQGANYFSWEPVVWMRLDLGAFDEVFTNEIAGFPAALRDCLPSLFDHHCSPGVPGGFLQRVTEGTLLGHVVEHVAIELQQLAGITVNFGKTRATALPGLYNVLFEFKDDQAGLMAGHAAVALINTLVRGESFDAAPIVDRLMQIREERLLGPSTQALVDAADRRSIPWMRLDGENLVQLGTGRFQRRIRATLTSRTGLIAYETALDKALSLSLLADAAVPVPDQICSSDPDPIIAFAARRALPVTIKPRQGVLGRGVSVGVTIETLPAAIAAARQVHPEVIAQATLAGDCFRLLTIGARLVAAARLDPPIIQGDGQSSIAALVAAMNLDPRRQRGDKGKLSAVTLDDTARRLIAGRGLGPDSILGVGERLALQVSGSMKLGGSATDVTDMVHPETRLLAERASLTIGLDVAGIDIIAQDIGQPLAPQGGAVIEIGAAPDFRPHLAPTEGVKRDVAALLLDSLFPLGQADHAKTISITGGEGSTKLAHWMADCLARLGHHVALATRRGLFAAGELLRAADASQPEFAKIALRDPKADIILLETDLYGILRGGLGYGLADIGVVTNFVARTEKSDDVRLDHIEDQAYAQSVVAEQVRKPGVAILNADQYLVSEVRQRLQSEAIWFSRNDLNRTVRGSLRRDGRAILLDEQGVIWLRQGRQPGLRLADLTALLGSPPEQSWQIDMALAGTAILLALGVGHADLAPLMAGSRPAGGWWEKDQGYV